MIKLAFYDGALEDIQYYITTEFNGYFEGLAYVNTKTRYVTIDAGKGINKVLKDFNQLNDSITDDQIVIITNSADLLNKVSYNDIYLFQDGEMHQLQELTTRQLRYSHDIRKLYLSGEFKTVLVSKKKNKYEAKGWPYESINPEYPLNKPVKNNTVLANHTDPNLNIANRKTTIKQYYAIHKLRTKEDYRDGEFCQFVTAVDEEWVAKDICDRYNKSAAYAGYKLEYKTINVEVDVLTKFSFMLN